MVRPHGICDTDHQSVIRRARSPKSSEDRTAKMFRPAGSAIAERANPSNKNAIAE
jgi:hypothetical protein